MGSNLCARLMEDETNEIWCLDDLSTGRMENIEHFLKDPRFTFLEQDVQKPVDLDVQQIYHAACPASPPAYQKDPVNTTKTCVLGTLNMLELARKYGAVLVNFSTSEVYGDPEAHPTGETSIPPVSGAATMRERGALRACALIMCGSTVRRLRLSGFSILTEKIWIRRTGAWSAILLFRR